MVSTQCVSYLDTTVAGEEIRHSGVLTAFYQLKIQGIKIAHYSYSVLWRY